MAILKVSAALILFTTAAVAQTGLGNGGNFGAGHNNFGASGEGAGSHQQQGGFHGHGQYYHHPKYHYEYAVHDDHTQDIKKHYESRDGDKTEGEYSFKEADGTTRTVKYHVNGKSGFIATVHHTGHSQHPQTYNHYHAPAKQQQVVAIGGGAKGGAVNGFETDAVHSSGDIGTFNSAQGNEGFYQQEEGIKNFGLLSVNQGGHAGNVNQGGHAGSLNQGHGGVIAAQSVLGAGKGGVQGGAGKGQGGFAGAQGGFAVGNNGLGGAQLHFSGFPGGSQKGPGALTGAQLRFVGQQGVFNFAPIAYSGALAGYNIGQGEIKGLQGWEGAQGGLVSGKGLENVRGNLGGKGIAILSQGEIKGLQGWEGAQGGLVSGKGLENVRGNFGGKGLAIGGNQGGWAVGRQQGGLAAVSQGWEGGYGGLQGDFGGVQSGFRG